MHLRSNILLILASLTCVLSSPTTPYNDTIELAQGPGNFNADQVEDILIALQDFNAHQHGTGFITSARSKPRSEDLSTRSDWPLLDKILTMIDNSGIAITVIDYVLLKPELLDLTINTTIWVIRLRLINLTNLLIALRKSGLVIETLTLSLNDPDILPGLISITKEVIKQGGLKVNLFNKREEKTALLQNNIDIEQETSPTKDLITLSKRESYLLDQLFLSLRESGLAIAVVQHILTSPQLVSANAHFVVSILQLHALNIVDLINALKESGLLTSVFKDLLGNPQTVKDFAKVVMDKVKKGLIPQKLFDP
ncbi:uncharacterized protein KGF55_000353 [Candida pseudojiufengensis]|uniref:uncharacterized protein n=1 Tax=Candida pseudojiufengensis TaxID=497109 RepID=UPI002225852F|nr:uncharacterized protein KGF55_000353 [Candida pseudojiufengensis]KAI5966944.1 hypothetical protein KGF55_000353 [Candida pseudojiufengensis]